MQFTESQKAEIRDAMEQYAMAYRKKDIRAFFSLFSPYITGFGSGADEIITDHKSLVRQIQRDISQAETISAEFTGQKISGEGRIAWVAANTAITFTIRGSKKQVLRGRSTMVLKNTGRRWRIEQLHFSMPYGGQSAGQSFPGA